MSKSKKPKQNPIEEAIGPRATSPVAKQILSQTRDELSPSEMVNLEELNRQTEERLLDNPEPMATILIKTTTGKTVEVPQAAMPSQKTLVSKPDPQPVTKTSTRESPPQNVIEDLEAIQQKETPVATDSVSDNIREKEFNYEGMDDHDKHVEVCNTSAEKLGIPKIVIPDDGGVMKKPSAEDKDLTALREYILGNGFVVAMVAMHIRMLCTSAMTTPSTTDWDFEDRAHIPDLVLALLRQPGYIEGIWPSLSIIMNTNKANPAWTAGIAMTIAFFDCIRILPMLKELKNETM